MHRGELPPDVALDRLWRMKIKLLGDAVLRRRGLGSGGAMGWADTYTAEVALTQLQADAFVTLDEGLARSLDGVVATAPIDVLR